MSCTANVRFDLAPRWMESASELIETTLHHSQVQPSQVGQHCDAEKDHVRFALYAYIFRGKQLRALKATPSDNGKNVTASKGDPSSKLKNDFGFRSSLFGRPGNRFPAEKDMTVPGKPSRSWASSQGRSALRLLHRTSPRNGPWVLINNYGGLKIPQRANLSARACAFSIPRLWATKKHLDKTKPIYLWIQRSTFDHMHTWHRRVLRVLAGVRIQWGISMASHESHAFYATL